VAGCCECGDEPSGSYSTKLVTVQRSYRSLMCMLFKSNDGIKHFPPTFIILKSMSYHLPKIKGIYVTIVDTERVKTQALCSFERNKKTVKGLRRNK
jgi:hypothetical protein